LSSPIGVERRPQRASLNKKKKERIFRSESIHVSEEGNSRSVLQATINGKERREDCEKTPRSSAPGGNNPGDWDVVSEEEKAHRVGEKARLRPKRVAPPAFGKGSCIISIERVRTGGA